eukprot:6314063-Amphidinium_carterae.1
MVPCLAATPEGPLLVMLNVAVVKSAVQADKMNLGEMMRQLSVLIQRGTGTGHPGGAQGGCGGGAMSSVAPATRKHVVPADPKAQVCDLVQKKLRRTLTKEDIVYDVLEVQGGYQCTLTLHCFDGEAFIGDPSKERKEAERAAAREAIKLHGNGSGDKKRNIASLPQDGLEPKNEFTQYLQKYLRRALVKGDVVYENVEFSEGWQSTIHLSCMQDEEIVGDVADRSA